LLAFTWVPLEMKLNGSEKNIKEERKKIKNNNLQPRSEKRETGSGISPASIRVLIND